MREMPAIASSAYVSNTLNWNDAMGAFEAENAAARKLAFAGVAAPMQHLFNPQSTETNMAAQRRLVQVFIADPNENVPLDDSILYRGDQKLTDATDQELFFELDIKGLLDTHNAKRIKVVDKKVKERTEYLEPAKVRDLKMVVATIASF